MQIDRADDLKKKKKKKNPTNTRPTCHSKVDQISTRSTELMIDLLWLA
jgi:hypothetical protein